MKLRIEYPPVSGGDVKHFDDDGKEVRVAYSEVTPLFFQPSANAVALYLSTKDANDKDIASGTLRLAGATGQLKVLKQAKPVVPAYDALHLKDSPELEDDEEYEEEEEDDEYEEEDD
jgi:hypothetical protein